MPPKTKPVKCYAVNNRYHERFDDTAHYYRSNSELFGFELVKLTLGATRDFGKTLKIIVHRGTREIGGSCVELHSTNCRLVIDMGMPLMKPGGGEFDFREYNSLSGPELVEEGVLPQVEGFYSWQEPAVDGVLLSHAHQDHYGLVNYVHPDISVYLGEGAQKLIELTALFTPTKISINKPVVFPWPEAFTVRDFRITPHLVDHSCFGSFAFEVEADGKRLFYSGDFRDHGYLGKTLDIIASRCRPGCDLALMEGTMFGRDDERVLTEQQLADQAKEICDETSGAVLVYQSGQNISRAVSFYKAARASGREFVLDFYAAHVLTELGKCSGGDRLPYPGNMPGIRVWFPNSLTNRAKKDGYFDIPSRYAADWKMSKEEMAQKLDTLMLFVRPGMERDLRKIPGLANSTLLYSLWSGYRDKPNTKRFIDTCAELGIVERALHTSGHATKDAMRRLLDAIKPKVLVPIHTLHRDQYVTLGFPVLFPGDGEEFSF